MENLPALAFFIFGTADRFLIPVNLLV